MCNNTENEEKIRVINHMSKSGKTRNEVADFLGITLESLKYFLRKNNIKFSNDLIKNCEFCKKEYITKNRNSKTCSNKCSDKLYDAKRRIKSRVCKLFCKTCRTEFENKYYKSLYCDTCRENTNISNETKRSEMKASYELNTHRKRLIKLLNILQSKARECKQCKVKYIFIKGNESGVKYCTNNCKKEAAKTYKNYKNNSNKDKRLSLNGKPDYSITLNKLYNRDNGECHICGKQTNYNDMIINGNGHYIAGNSYPSIDHVLPIARGGLHQWNNVKLAHRICNSIKRDG